MKLLNSTENNQPTMLEDIQALRSLLIELLTGTPERTLEEKYGRKAIETAPASLRWLIKQSAEGDDKARYDLYQFVQRLRYTANGQCLCDELEAGGPIPIQVAIKYTIRLCANLERHHEVGITHHNLVAENVILEKIGQQRRADWINFEVQNGREYENLTEERQHDTYAIGHLLFSMLTGGDEKPPEKPATLAARLDDVSPWTSLGLDRILIKALIERSFPEVTILSDRLRQNLEFLRQIHEITDLIRAGYPLIYIVSWEEKRVLQALHVLAKTLKQPMFTWSLTQGIHDPSGSSLPTTQDPGDALDHVVKSNVENGLFVFMDLHPFLKVGPGSFPPIRRKLREVSYYIRRSKKSLVILAPVQEIPPECEKDITVISFPLPAPGDLTVALDSTIATIKRSGGQVELSHSNYEDLLRAATGLTVTEAELAFTRAMMQKWAKTGEPLLDSGAIEVVSREKEKALHRTGALEIFTSSDGFEDIGGLDGLKNWFNKRSKAFSIEAQEFGLPWPKGVLLVGVAGCGKSLAAKAIASEWKKPLLRLDAGALFSSRVGSSEENLRNALQAAEAIAPCILWIDEIEKVFSGLGSTNDGGVTARVFGGLLTWMQEKKAPVFIVATANNVGDQSPNQGLGYGSSRGLPPEFLRKGRFDELFFVDLPTPEEREAIFSVHISKRGYDPNDYNLSVLSEASKNYSGAEIEQAVIGALYDAFNARNRLHEHFPIKVRQSKINKGESDTESLSPHLRPLYWSFAFSSDEDVLSDSDDSKFISHFSNPNLIDLEEDLKVIENKIAEAGFTDEQLESAFEALFLEDVTEMYPDVFKEVVSSMGTDPKAVNFLRGLISDFEEEISLSQEQAVGLINQLESQALEKGTNLPFVLSQEAILRNLESIYPLYKMRQSQIEDLRQWARDNTVPASNIPQDGGEDHQDSVVAINP